MTTNTNKNSLTTTIQLILEDGTLDGILYLKTLRWPLGGIMLVSPRDKVTKLLDEYEECNNWGIYLLIAKDQVYVGQSSELKQRIEQHLLGKDWWEKVFLFTTSNNSLDKSGIDYLESKLIDKAKANNKLSSDNKKNGNKTNIDRFRETELKEYLNELIFLLDFINIDVFNDNTNKKNNLENVNLSNIIKPKSEEEIRSRSKQEIFSYIETKTKIDLKNNTYYSKYYDRKNYYWFTLKNNSVNSDLKLVLNDINSQEITILQIPAKKFEISDTKGTNKFQKTRSDNKFDLYINNVLFEKQNKIDFTEYVIDKIRYSSS
ncbi:Uncharacterised protein (plasmid) [Mesomycoplasma conjunctivae]|nr:GIY-YIG nuclease family protein [Mycoplasmopsis fermentans]ADV34818.1 Hypothetical Protein MfeM64YM_0823 [Mycoplasmopsis fermentans M64]VEU67291.1 Uncharacterised protein [Mesomycoplasma conjunctivae]